MKRRRDSTSSSSGDQNNTKGSSSEQQQSKRKKTTSENNRSAGASNSQPSVSVRLQNADMLSKYRNKNSHIVIENPKSKSNYMGTEISDDDEIWLCEIPNSIDVNSLLGKSLKLGSKKTNIKITNETQVECVSSKFDQQNDAVYANTVSVVFQNDDAKLSLKNLKARGTMSIHKKIDDDPRETIQLHPTVRHQCTIFPESLKVRHPLFGYDFADKIEINERIAQKLAADQAIDNDSYGDDGICIKQEKDDDSSTNVSPKKASKASKSNDKSISIKTEENQTTSRNGLDDDLDRIKQIFQHC